MIVVRFVSLKLTFSFYQLSQNCTNCTKSELCGFTNVFDSFVPLNILNTSGITSSILLGTHILPNGSSTELQLPLHVSRLTINEQKYSSSSFKLIIVRLTIHCWLFMDNYFIANHLPKPNSTSTSEISTFLINLVIFTILCLSSNTWE